MSDQWCEQQFWLNLGIDTQYREVFAASTGLLMCLIPFLYPNYQMTFLLYALEINIIILGIGTFIFHWWPIDKYDAQMVAPLDWIPMILTIANLLFICIYSFFSCFTVCFKVTSVMFVVGWLFVMLYLSTQEYDVWISELLLVLPSSLILFIVSFEVDLHEAWFYLFISLFVWIVNRFACHLWAGLGLLHGVWHITITYALWSVGVILTNFY